MDSPDLPQGVYARVEIERADGELSPLEIAIGPADTLGDLEDVLNRFCEAYCLGVDATAFTLGDLIQCSFDPATVQVTMGDGADGLPPIAMDRRFAFGFIAMLGEEYDYQDPFLVVRPCTREEVKVWKGLMGADPRFKVRTWCLDERLTERMRHSGDGGERTPVVSG